MASYADVSARITITQVIAYAPDLSATPLN